eukprot:TRINITY_DN3168_c2_g1_i1.p1 TRINITY_DN3168_c2_g1~~TRINITY_DN3168_c2_g1_i1.p1  ORF type:complete len:665 (+),score=151.35 TRINITY_DN3168_c2_g1_i1:32-1996(+)
MDERRIDPADGKAKPRKIFIEVYGGLAEWNSARPEEEELRVDPADGNRYTKTQFIECYGGTAQWERAAEEHRIDEADGKAYTKRDFIVCYGGTDEWEKARPVGTKAEPHPEPPKPELEEPDFVEPEPEPEPESKPEPVPEPARPASPGIPGRKTERKVIQLTPEELKELTKKQEEEREKRSRAPPKAAIPRVDSCRSNGGGTPSPSQVRSPLKKVLKGYAQTEGLKEACCDKPAKIGGKDGRSQLSIVVVGHVDAGKSTLMGHLLCRLGVVAQRTLHKYEKDSKALGKASFHYAWVLDETEEERLRGVTMDVATACFQTPSKQVVLLDAPGHSAFVGNTCNGITQADIALIVVNAVQGEFEAGLLRGQTREHTYILRGSGIKHLIIAVNKIDAVEDSQERFLQIKTELGKFLEDTGFKPENVRWIPVSGLQGYNLNQKPGEHIPWWDGATLVDMIDETPQVNRWPGLPLRMSISDVSKNTVGGRIETGTIKKSDKVTILPSGEVGQVKQIEKNQIAVDEAFSGDHVELTLAGVDPANVLIGMAVSSVQFPVKVSSMFEAQVMVVSPNVMIMKSFKCVLHIQSASIDATVTKMLPLNGKVTRCLTQGKTGLVKFTLSQPLCVETLQEFKGFGRIVVRADGLTVAMGAVNKIYVEE